MQIRICTIAVGIALASAPLASAQQVYNPIVASPYSRPTLSPYLNLTGSGTAATTYYGAGGVLGQTWLNNQALRPLPFLADFLSGYDPYRTPAYAAVSGYQQNTEDYALQYIRETQMSPSGHPTGFLMANPYYRMPNQHSFIPYTPTTAQQQPR